MAKKSPGDFLTSKERLEAWMAKNAVFVVIGMVIVSILALAIVYAVLSQSAKRESVYQKVIERATRYAVITDGIRIAMLKKEPLAAGVLKNYTTNSVYNYFVLDRNDFLLPDGKFPILRGTDEKSILAELPKISPKVKKLTYFFDLNDGGSKKALYAYLKFLYSEGRSGELPDTIKPVGEPKNLYFESDGSTFEWRGEVPVVSTWVGIDGKTHQGRGTIYFKLNGVYKPNPEKLNFVNPYGMVVKEMKFRYVKVVNNPNKGR